MILWLKCDKKNLEPRSKCVTFRYVCAIHAAAAVPIVLNESQRRNVCCTRLLIAKLEYYYNGRTIIEFRRRSRIRFIPVEILTM